MKTLQSLLIAVITVLLIGCGSTREQTQSTETTPQQKQETATITEFEVDGLKVIMKRTPGNPVVAAGFYLDGGTRYEPMELAGIERFMFQTSLHGTDSLSKDALNAALESMGTNIYAEPTYDYNGLTLTSLQRNFDKSWDLYTEVLVHPTFPPDELTLMKQQLVNSIKREKDDPDSYLQRVSNEFYYAGHPYAVSLSGTLESVELFTQERLTGYHEANVVKSRGLLVFVGDIPESKVRGKAAQLAAALPAGPGEYTVQSDKDFNAGSADLKIVSRDLPTNYIRGLCEAPRIGSSEYPAFFAAIRILDDKLFEEIRTKRNLSYAPASGISSRANNYAALYVTTVAPDTTVKVMFETIDNMISTPLTEKELLDMITQTITRELMSQESAEVQRSKLARFELVGGGTGYSEQFIEQLKQVKPADVQNVLKQYAHNWHFAVIGDSTQVDPELFTSR